MHRSQFSMELEKVHVVLFPYLSKGHMIPMLQLARLLLSHSFAGDISVTVFTLHHSFESSFCRWLTLRHQSSSWSNIVKKDPPSPSDGAPAAILGTVGNFKSMFCDLPWESGEEGTENNLAQSDSKAVVTYIYIHGPNAGPKWWVKETTVVVLRQNGCNSKQSMVIKHFKLIQQFPLLYCLKLLIRQLDSQAVTSHHTNKY